MHDVIAALTHDSFAALQRSMSYLIADDAWLEDLETHAMPEDVPAHLRRRGRERLSAPSGTEEP